MLSLSSLLFSDAFFWMLRVSPVTGSFPQPLSAAREQEALEALQQGDADAKNLLIEHNLRLVAHVVKKYYASREDQDDLVSIGTIGLIKAVNSYRLEKNIKFATYASRCIENATLSPATLSPERRWIGGFWSGSRRISISFPTHRIRRRGMRPYISPASH